MKVKNINGTSDNTCKCKSWLDHWETYSGQKLPEICPENTCFRSPQVGAHVQKDSAVDSSWYIIPLCKHHNAKSDSLTVSNTIKLAPANVSETCGS